MGQQTHDQGPVPVRVFAAALAAFTLVAVLTAVVLVLGVARQA